MKNVRTTARTYHYEKNTVLLNTPVYERLKTYGKFGETFSDVIEKLMNEIDENRKK